MVDRRLAHKAKKCAPLLKPPGGVLTGMGAYSRFEAKRHFSYYFPVVNSSRRHFPWFKQPILLRAPRPANGDISHGLSNQLSHGLQDQPMATFPMAKQPALSRAPGPANGDISHGLSNQLSHGLQDQPMATFPMAKQPALSRAPGPANGDISHGLNSQPSHGSRTSQWRHSHGLNSQPSHGSRTSQWRHFSWLKQPDLSRLQDQPMATFLMA